MLGGREPGTGGQRSGRRHLVPVEVQRWWRHLEYCYSKRDTVCSLYVGFLGPPFYMYLLVCYIYSIHVCMYSIIQNLYLQYNLHVHVHIPNISCTYMCTTCIQMCIIRTCTFTHVHSTWRLWGLLLVPENGHPSQLSWLTPPLQNTHSHSHTHTHTHTNAHTYMYILEEEVVNWFMRLTHGIVTICMPSLWLIK